MGVFELSLQTLWGFCLSLKFNICSMFMGLLGGRALSQIKFGEHRENHLSSAEGKIERSHLSDKIWLDMYFSEVLVKLQVGPDVWKSCIMLVRSRLCVSWFIGAISQNPQNRQIYTPFLRRSHSLSQPNIVPLDTINSHFFEKRHRACRLCKHHHERGYLHHRAPRRLPRWWW